jgi:ribosomal protein L32
MLWLRTEECSTTQTAKLSHHISAANGQNIDVELET